MAQQYLELKTSEGSVRKYPNVMWFPRSKTDPQEIREVLKLALKIQDENSDKYFNDKLLGEHMARIGSINVLGMKGEDYIKSYQGKSIGDVSYITNARMLMRLFRFLGLATRLERGKYAITVLGRTYVKFNGDFPSQLNGENEEQILLQLLANFAFYCVNDDSKYRDSSFQVRPFIWLLNTLAIEPQCIIQLIVTAYASKSEGFNEIKRIKNILSNLKSGKSTLKDEFTNLGLNPNDYSCVHNFYDSAKILVYLGISLGLVKKTKSPTYGRKIAGNAKYLKNASAFYNLTVKGEKYLEENIQKKLIYYSDLYKVLGNKDVLQCSFILAVLNTSIGAKKIESININFFKKILGNKWEKYTNSLRKNLQIEIEIKDGKVALKDRISFNFFQSMPPEFLYDEPMKNWYTVFMEEFSDKKSKLLNTTTSKMEEQFSGEITSKFILDKDKNLAYEVPSLTLKEAQDYIKYEYMDNIFGGQDRYASRISPTNSVILVGDKVHVDNVIDALDLLIPLRHPDERLRKFIDANISQLLKTFLSRSDTWAKDQHYAWVRNCFRLFGATAIYSGSSGMLSRADISIIDPFLGGVEAKSPSENRGSINTKAIRQALDAKVQVVDLYPEKKGIPKIAIAIGRRITPLAIAEEKKWRSGENQPVLLITDVVLYYLTLKSLDIPFDDKDLIRLFTQNVGLLDTKSLSVSLEEIMNNKKIDSQVKEKIREELNNLGGLVSGSIEGAIEE
ncbi:MAG: hypothetical protein Q7S45_01835 [Candidatus Curtissbacteria bacterium]|nr:hypothetical protein [Candidatus Curtissbacteria bacterium]